MKYKHEIEISLPRQKVIDLFDNQDNIKKWQPGLVSFKHLSGEPGEVGAKSLLHYDMGKRKVDMIETITKKNFPDEFSGTYEAKGVFNKIDNHFIELGPNTTKWVAVNEFIMNNLMMKLMAFLMPGAFKKQSYKYMQYFKDFAEKKHD